ncbi:uncharacterized protein LOC144450122 [Glandiceps talaboti]
MYLGRVQPLSIATVMAFWSLVKPDTSCTTGNVVCSGDVTCPYQSSKVNQECIDGNCKCTNPDYSTCTCLPKVIGCEIGIGRDNSMATYKLSGFNDPLENVYNCFNPGNSQNEVHVIANYQGTGNNQGDIMFSTGNTQVDIHGLCNGVPITLVFVSHNPVNWILNFDDPDVILAKVLLITPYITTSYISHQHGRITDIEKYSDMPWGYGDDKQQGDTVGLLQYLTQRFGAVTSFTGTYQADEWNLNLLSELGTELTTTGEQVEDCWTGDMCNSCPEEYIGAINQIARCCPGCRYPRFIYRGIDCFCKIEALPQPCVSTVNTKPTTTQGSPSTRTESCLHGNACSQCSNTINNGTGGSPACCPNCLHDTPVFVGDVCYCNLATKDNGGDVSGGSFLDLSKLLLLVTTYILITLTNISNYFSE